MMTVIVVEDVTEIVDGSEATEVVAQSGSIEVVTVGEQGPRGVQGVPGPAGGDAFVKLSVGPIGGHRVVKLSGSAGAEYASADQVGDADLVLGITAHAASDGDELSIIRRGGMEDSSWNWIPEQPVFLGINGVLTQTLPLGAAFLQRVAVAVTATELFVDVPGPILF